MTELFNDIHSDVNFLENEKFDFDLPFSPTLADTNEPEVSNNEDEDEVFFGPVGFTEQCMSTRVSHMQDDNLKPLSPLSGEQAVELFTEATKLALHIERLSTETTASDVSLSQSNTSSEQSSILSNSTYFRLSNHSSSSGSSSSSKFSSVGKSSSGADSEAEKPVLPSFSDLTSGNESSSDKENHGPLIKRVSNKNLERHDEQDGRNVLGSNGSKEEVTVAPLATKQQVTKTVTVSGVTASSRLPGKTAGRSIPKPGSACASRLPRSKNMERSHSAFNSPIKAPEYSHHNETMRNRNTERITRSQTNNSVTSVEKSDKNVALQRTKLASAQKSAETTRNNGTPARARGRTSENALTKRNIFRSTESLKDAETKDGRSKGPEQRKIPGPKSRRRSSSTSSLSSQSSTSSCQAPMDEGPPTVITTTKPASRLAKPAPTTKASLTSSLPVGLFRRATKVSQENAPSDKRTHPVKALPRSAIGSIKKPKSGSATHDKGHRVSDELSCDDKVPLVATPQPVLTSAPVSRRKSLLRRPATTGKKASESSVDSVQKRRSGLTDLGTPNKQDLKVSTAVTRKTRRSLLPTPSRGSSAKSRVFSDDLPTAMPSSPAVALEKENLQDGRNIKVKIKEALLMNTDSPKILCTQSVDDLLQMDHDLADCSDEVMPIQPKPVLQADLIDLSGI